MPINPKFTNPDTVKPKQTISPATLTEIEAARYLNVSRSFLARGRMEGGSKYPTFLKLGRSIRYRVSELDAWLDRSTRTSTVYL